MQIQVTGHNAEKTLLNLRWVGVSEIGEGEVVSEVVGEVVGEVISEVVGVEYS